MQCQLRDIQMQDRHQQQGVTAVANCMLRHVLNVFTACMLSLNLRGSRDMFELFIVLAGHAASCTDPVWPGREYGPHLEAKPGL